MATTLTVSQFRVNLAYDFENVLTMGNTSDVNNHLVNLALTQGTGAAGTADLLYTASVTIASSGNTTVTFTALADVFGISRNFARIKVIVIENSALGSATSILVGNGTNPFINWVGSGAHTVRVRNGGFLALGCTDATAYAVTAATGDLLKIVNEDALNSAQVHMSFVGSTS
jgi:hypothetical protein